MGIFITDNDTIDIALYTGTVNGDIVCAETEEEAKEKFKDNTFEKHIITFKKMNYGTMKKIQNASMQESEGRFVFNPIKFRAERFLQSIKTWSFKDSVGNQIPVSSQNIDNMSDSVAKILLDLFDRKTE